MTRTRPSPLWERRSPFQCECWKTLRPLRQLSLKRTSLSLLNVPFLFSLTFVLSFQWRIKVSFFQQKRRRLQRRRRSPQPRALPPLPLLLPIPRPRLLPRRLAQEVEVEVGRALKGRPHLSLGCQSAHTSPFDTLRFDFSYSRK